MGYNTHAFDYMLPSTHRLTKRKDFDTLFKRGRVVFGRHVQLRVGKRQSEGPTRFAFVVSAKTEKSAVRRNRVKRQAREIVRAVLPDVKPGFDAAITIRSGFLALSHEDKRDMILSALRKAGVLAPKK